MISWDGRRPSHKGHKNVSFLRKFGKQYDKEVDNSKNTAAVEENNHEYSLYLCMTTSIIIIHRVKTQQYLETELTVEKELHFKIKALRYFHCTSKSHDFYQRTKHFVHFLFLFLLRDTTAGGD